MMEWVSENWIWLLLGGAMIGMHLFGHGGHGGRGGHGGGHGGGGGCCGGHGKDKGAGADEAQGAVPGKLPAGGDGGTAK